MSLEQSFLAFHVFLIKDSCGVSSHAKPISFCLCFKPKLPNPFGKLETLDWYFLLSVCSPAPPEEKREERRLVGSCTFKIYKMPFISGSLDFTSIYLLRSANSTVLVCTCWALPSFDVFIFYKNNSRISLLNSTAWCEVCFQWDIKSFYAIWALMCSQAHENIFYALQELSWPL